MRSKSELRNRLIRKNFNEKDVTDIIKNLELKGYLDDEKFAHAFAKEKVKNKLIVPISLKFEMFKCPIIYLITFYMWNRKF